MKTSRSHSMQELLRSFYTERIDPRGEGKPFEQLTDAERRDLAATTSFAVYSMDVSARKVLSAFTAARKKV